MVNFESIINQQMNSYSSGLVILDENINVQSLHHNNEWEALTNRFDQYSSLKNQNWKASFSDFDWPENCEPNTVIFRISKEKAVVNHLLNLFAEKLKKNSTVILLGDKSEGIKSYAKNAQKLFGGMRKEKKLGGDSWFVELSISSNLGSPLDDQEYITTRAICDVSEYTLFSKPGVYGWKKIDKGSQQLIERLPHMTNKSLPFNNISVLDLGCGSGYLSIAAASPTTKITATDNNAAALIATKRTLESAGFNAKIELSNAGEELSGPFDLILCNPPFHSGFGIDYDLTDRFSKQASRLLSEDGIACFVVNQHVPLKRIASAYFHVVELDLDSNNFCTYKLQNPKR